MDSGWNTAKRMELRSSAWQRFCWEGEELSCTCVVMAVCVSTHCHFTCFVLCAQNSELYVMRILQQYKTTKHLAICLPYLYAGKGKEQAHYGGQNLLPDTKQSCSLVSVPVRCRHEAKSKGQQQWGLQVPCLSFPEFKTAGLASTGSSLSMGYCALTSTNTLEASLLFREICITSTPTTHTLLGSNGDRNLSPKEKRFSKVNAILAMPGKVMVRPGSQTGLPFRQPESQGTHS